MVIFHSYVKLPEGNISIGLLIVWLSTLISIIPSMRFFWSVVSFFKGTHLLIKD